MTTASDWAERPELAANGRSVVFYSAPLGPTGSIPDHGSLYVRDLQAQTTTLVNRASGPDGAAGDVDGRYSADASISPDGHLVAFSSDAPNLTTNDTNRANEVYIRDLRAQTTELISRTSEPDGAPRPTGDRSMGS